MKQLNHSPVCVRCRPTSAANRQHCVGPPAHRHSGDACCGVGARGVPHAMGRHMAATRGTLHRPCISRRPQIRCDIGNGVAPFCFDTVVVRCAYVLNAEGLDSVTCPKTGEFESRRLDGVSVVLFNMRTWSSFERTADSFFAGASCCGAHPVRDHGNRAARPRRPVVLVGDNPSPGSLP